MLDRQLIKLDRSGDYYLIRSYHAAWKVFGINKTWCRAGQYNRVFCKKSDNTESKDILKSLFQHKSDSLAKQIRYARKTGRLKSFIKIEAPLSAKTVAKLFGYKQPCTGSRKRKQFFKVVNEPLKRIMVYIPSVDPFRAVSRYKTRTVLV